MRCRLRFRACDSVVDMPPLLPRTPPLVTAALGSRLEGVECDRRSALTRCPSAQAPATLCVVPNGFRRRQRVRDGIQPPEAAAHMCLQRAMAEGGGRSANHHGGS
jgi:hypothetical protein